MGRILVEGNPYDSRWKGRLHAFRAGKHRSKGGFDVRFFAIKMG